ncbi:MAG: 6,7-dimethyl-8-ribityllumazine synthase [Candidatus Theseobacter exili]|nr:6,7-dimethyl-8-ribityllumazine synthase [Candidatus Theseobacter exili]
MNYFEGNYSGKNLKIAIVVGRFNSHFTEELVKGAKDCLIRHEVNQNNIDVFYVPGSLEIPFIIRQVAATNKHHGVIALGAVIRGETSHFDIVSNEVAKGIAQLNLTLSIPTSFGVITVDTLEQAINRSGAKSGNKGFDAALSLLETINLTNQLK